MTIDWTCKTCHQLASFKSFQSHPPLRFICACGDNNFDGSGEQHHSGEGGAVRESEKPLKTSIDEMGNRQPEIQGPSTSSITRISDSETGGGPGEGGQGGQGDGFKGNRQREIRGPGTSLTAQISDSEPGGGPGEAGRGGQVMRKDIAGQQLKDPVPHQPTRFQIQKRELDQDREGGQGGQDEIGNRQPETQGSGTSSTTQILNSGTGGRSGEGGQGGQVRRKDIASQQLKDPVPHEPIRFQNQKRKLDQDREGGQGGQGDEKANRQPETQGSGTSSATQILDLGTGGGPGEGGQGGQVMRKDIAGQQLKDPVLHQAKRLQIQKRGLDQDRAGGQGGQGDEKGNRQSETQGSGTSSTTQISDSGTGGRPGEGGQGGQMMRKDIAGQQLKDPVPHQPIGFQNQKRELDQDREGGQGGQDEEGNRQSETQGSGTSSTTQISDSGTGGRPGEGGQGGQGLRDDVASPVPAVDKEVNQLKYEV